MILFMICDEAVYTLANLERTEVGRKVQEQHSDFHSLQVFPFYLIYNAQYLLKADT